MKYLFQSLFILSVLFTAGKTYAQIPDPTTWTYSVKKTGANEYEIIFHLELKEGWHIWSMTPGGDGTLIAPSFTFDKNDKVQLKGSVKQTGKLITKEMEGIDGKVNYYSATVDYAQDIIVSAKTKLSGTHEYQVCNDKMCLPPKDKDFSIEIGN